MQRRQAARSSSAVTDWGIPVSSTHAINGAIIGVGATRGKNAVQWRVVREMMTAWIITIPLAVVVAYAGYFMVAFVPDGRYRVRQYFAIFLRSTADYQWVCYGSSRIADTAG